MRQRFRFDLRPGYYESHALTTQQRTLNVLQTLVANKVENRSMKLPTTNSDYSKSTSKQVNIFICELD